jgi:hypothetical protein
MSRSFAILWSFFWPRVEIAQLPAQALQRTLKMRFYRAICPSRNLRGFVHGKPLEVDEYEGLALTQWKSLDRIGDPVSQDGVAAWFGTGIAGLVRHLPSTANPNPTPTPMAPCLIDENTIEPCGERCVLAKSREATVCAQEGILCDIFGRAGVVSEQPPCEPDRTITMFGDEFPEANFEG